MATEVCIECISCRRILTKDEAIGEMSKVSNFDSLKKMIETMRFYYDCKDTHKACPACLANMWNIFGEVSPG